MGHASISSGLLRLEASPATVSQFASKLTEERRWVVHVKSSWRSRGDKAEDRRVDATGCIRLFYPNFVVFVVLSPRGILVLGHNSVPRANSFPIAMWSWPS
jgi:hypothetical protein